MKPEMIDEQLDMTATFNERLYVFIYSGSRRSPRTNIADVIGDIMMAALKEKITTGRKR